MCEHNIGDIYTLLILTITDISIKEMSSFNTWYKYLQLFKNIHNIPHLLTLNTSDTLLAKLRHWVTIPLPTNPALPAIIINAISR